MIKIKKVSMNEPPQTDESAPPEKIQNIVFGAILISLFVIVCRFFAPFFTVLLWSILLYVLLSPLHRRLMRRVDQTKRGGIVIKNILAAVFALGTIIVILIPLSFVTFQFLKQIIDLTHVVRQTFSTDPGILEHLFTYVSDFIRDITAGQIYISADDIQHRILIFLSSGTRSLIQFSSSVAMNIGNFLLSMALMVFCLFFFYVDGPYLSRLLLHLIPIRKSYLSNLVGKFMDITRNLFLGYIMVAFFQAILAFIVFSIFQVKGALVFAVLTFICVFIPMIGGSLVWLPLGIVRILSGNLAGGIVFLLVSALCISSLDNFLRPMFLQNRIQLHPLIIFFSILGGLSTLGFNGLILGPMIVIFFLTVLDLFLTEHKMNSKD
jgi:predicted PurR-regulated permease PerM